MKRGTNSRVATRAAERKSRENERNGEITPEHIAKDFQIHKIEEVENEDSDSEEDVGERTVSLQVQLIFDPSEMEDDEPTEDAISRFDEELRTHLTSRYQVTHLDVLDDGLTSYLLAELDESDETQTKCTNGL